MSNYEESFLLSITLCIADLYNAMRNYKNLSKFLQLREGEIFIFTFLKLKSALLLGRQPYNSDTQ